MRVTERRKTREERRNARIPDNVLHPCDLVDHRRGPVAAGVLGHEDALDFAVHEEARGDGARACITAGHLANEAVSGALSFMLIIALTQVQPATVQSAVASVKERP